MVSDDRVALRWLCAVGAPPRRLPAPAAGQRCARAAWPLLTLPCCARAARWTKSAPSCASASETSRKYVRAVPTRRIRWDARRRQLGLRVELASDVHVVVRPSLARPFHCPSNSPLVTLCTLSGPSVSTALRLHSVFAWSRMHCAKEEGGGGEEWCQHAGGGWHVPRKLKPASSRRRSMPKPTAPPQISKTPLGIRPQSIHASTSSRR